MLSIPSSHLEKEWTRRLPSHLFVRAVFEALAVEGTVVAPADTVVPAGDRVVAVVETVVAVVERVVAVVEKVVAVSETVVWVLFGYLKFVSVLLMENTALEVLMVQETARTVVLA